ncbi:regulatory protein RecX [Abyssibacter sp.]|uniref:regulatory protein RecX n=1 Tax=Abyssibacter sp. TaxID=2320200 RepID=UPI003516D8C6
MSSQHEHQDERVRVCHKAVELLAAREHSQAELRRKLKQRFPESDDIDAVIAQMVAEGYLSDTRYAEARVRASLSRGHGPLMIRQKLQAAGVDAALAEQVLEDAAVDWMESARAVLVARFGSQAPQDRRETARRARFLSGRGFASDIIGRLLLE